MNALQFVVMHYCSLVVLAYTKTVMIIIQYHRKLNVGEDASFLNPPYTFR